MPTLTIDGKEVTVEKGTPIIGAAEQVGVIIPRYCYHPALTSPANCRMCLVEVEKMPKLQTACSTPVADGMVVHTSSDKVIKARKGVMEFLLINHPLDCPICDQAGECMLQEYSFDYGPDRSRFAERKVRLPKRPLGEHVYLDPNRCIKCSLCIRFCKEIVGVEELTFVQRGNEAEIDTFNGQPMTNKYSGNVVDICPVGALTLREFRHVERVWLLDHVESICTGCSRGCNTILGVKGQKILRVKPRFNPYVNDYWICDYGRFHYDHVNSPDRLKSALIRVGESLEPVSWKEALDYLGERLKMLMETDGPQVIAGLGSTHLTLEDCFLFVILMRELIGTPNLDFKPPEGRSSGSPLAEDHLLVERDKSPNYEGSRDMGIRPGKGGLGYPLILDAAREGRVKALYVAGADLKGVPGGHDALRSLELLVVQDLTVTETALLAHVVLPACSFAERDGTYTNSQGRVQRTRPAFPPVGESLPDWEIFSKVASRLGAEFNFKSAEEVFAEIANTVPGYQGMSYETLGNQGQDRSS